MVKKIFVLLVETAAVAYLFYYVLVTRGGYFAGMSATVMAISIFSEWSVMFYRLGRKSVSG